MTLLSQFLIQGKLAAVARQKLQNSLRAFLEIVLNLLKCLKL